MDRVEVIKSRNTKKISKVIFNFPSLMNNGAEEEVRREYQELLDAEEQLQEARDTVRTLETIFNEKKRVFNSKSSLFTLEFETTEKKHVIHEPNISLLGMGNDIIGRQSSI